jgi:Skp family chaperone for outer membrane proteins
MFFGLALLWFPAGLMAQAKEGPVAVVNFRKVVTKHPKAAKLEAELRAMSESANKVLQTKDEQLLNIEEKIRQVTKEGTTPDGKMKMDSAKSLLELQQKSLEAQEAAVQVRAQVSSAITQRRAQELPKIAADILEFVRAANNGKYALVMDSSALSPEGFPQVLDYPGATDLTDKVIELLPKETAEPKEPK